MCIKWKWNTDCNLLNNIVMKQVCYYFYHIVSSDTTRVYYTVTKMFFGNSYSILNNWPGEQDVEQDVVATLLQCWINNVATTSCAQWDASCGEFEWKSYTPRHETRVIADLMLAQRCTLRPIITTEYAQCLTFAG